MLFPTTLVGSYPQPDWLIDRAETRRPLSAARARTRAVAHSGAVLAEAQDDATLLAIKAQEDAGLDIITDGEIRRESYSNRFATALEGVDIDNPGTALDRSGHPNPVPRVVGHIRRKHAVQVEDLLFLQATHAAHGEGHGAGPVHDGAAGADRLLRRQPRAGSDGLRRGGERRDPRSVRAGADIVQIDEPYMQARPDEARAYRPQGAQPRARGRQRHDRRAHLLRLRGHHPRAALGLFVPAGAGASAAARRCRSRPRSRISIARCSATCRTRRSCSACSTSSDMNAETPQQVAARIRRALPYVDPRERHRRAGLRHEVPAARRCGCEVAGHGRGRAHRACRTERAASGESIYE